MPVTFAEIEKFDNGAQFLNADLHVHSFGGSHDVRDSAMTVEAIIDTAVTLGIRILAITDHNNDANTAKSIAYAQKYIGQLLVVPGVEITTAHGHLLAYFAPNDAASVRNLLGKINIVGNLGDQDAHTAMSMADVIKEAERLGGMCVAAHIDRAKSGFETLAQGYPNWKKDIILSSGLYGLEFDDATKLVWYSESDESNANGAERKKLMAARGNVPALMGRPDLAHVRSQILQVAVPGKSSHDLSSTNSVTMRSGPQSPTARLVCGPWRRFHDPCRAYWGCKLRVGSSMRRLITSAIT